MLVQSTVENGWYLRDGRLGAPYGLDMRDFPLADSLHFGIVRLIGLATANGIVASNVFFLLTFLGPHGSTHHHATPHATKPPGVMSNSPDGDPPDPQCDPTTCPTDPNG